jgi:hypothetical protein
MFKDIKVFYFPQDSSAGGSKSEALPNVEPIGELSDRDILNQEDDDADEDVSGGKGKDETDEEDEEKDEALSDEKESDDDEGSDGTEDEGVDEDEEDESDDEDDDSDEDDEDDSAEELSLSDLSKAVKKAAPDVFKKVPGLREALEQFKEISEVFATPDEAKIAARNSGYLNSLYNDVASGDVERTGNFLKAIKNTNEEAFEDFSHTILESIGKINPQLYGEVMLKPMKKALMSMYADALKTGNKNLAAVAIHAHNYWFETQDIKAPLEERKKATKSKEQEAWEKEKEEFENNKLTEFRGGITEVVNHSMKLSITKELDGIKLDDYQKRNIIRDIFLGVDEVLGSDKRYLGGIQSLFDQAKSSKYSPDWKSRIVKAYLQRARQALPAIRNRVLREAGIKVKESQKSESRRLVPAGLGGNKSEDKIDFSRVDRSKTTDMDILNGKPKYIK